MALSQMRFDEIMREYDRRRALSRRNAQEARRRVTEAIPQYKDIEDRMADLAMECADKVLEGDAQALERMKGEMEALAAEQKRLLLQHGFAEDFLEEKHVCPDCADTGYIDGREKCHCLRQAILTSLYRQSNIGDILNRENFETLRTDIYTDQESAKMKDIIARCRRFADDFGEKYENILLYGDVGTGKTFLTNCMAKAVLDKGYSVIYFTSNRLFDTLARELFQNEPDDEREVQNDIFTCDLLIIDDLGTEGVNSFVASRLFDVINERDLRKKSTIISTNLSFEQLADRYTERTFSRIYANYTVLHPDVEDIRIRKKRFTS